MLMIVERSRDFVNKVPHENSVGVSHVPEAKFPKTTPFASS